MEEEAKLGVLQRLAHLVYEAGMLRKTPRTGWAFLGTNEENVAEHSFRTTVLGYILARLAKRDAGRTLFLCLFHDLHEARTGDFNYLYHRYDQAHARKALEDATVGTGLAEEILGAFDEFEAKESVDALLAHDADQLDLICNLAIELAHGNTFAREWLDSALLRLKTKEGRELAEVLLRTDPNAWWYEGVEKSWWVDRLERD